VVVALRTGDRLALIWLALGVAALVYSTGRLTEVMRSVPGFNFFQGPGRYGLITTLAVAVLSAKALDRLRTRGSWPLAAALLIGVAVAMWMALALTAAEADSALLNNVRNPFTVGQLVVSDAIVSLVFLAAIVAAVLGMVLQWLGRDPSRPAAAPVGRWLLVSSALVVTTIDLWLVSRLIFYSEAVADPPIRHLAESPVRKILESWHGTARVYAPNANLPSALGAAATPVYLTFGPAEYEDPDLKMPESPGPRQVDWLRRAGVTHVLRERPVEPGLWPSMKLVWQGFDPLLNAAAGRYEEPFYLYELPGSRGRVAWQHRQARQSARVVELRSGRVEIEADSPSGGVLILTDLMHPGWQVTVDGAPAEALKIEGMYRGVAVPPGEHRVVWSYHPGSVYWGAIASGIALLLLAAIAHVRYWHPRRLGFLDEVPAP
jgi:hypothetical protein